MLPRLTIPRLTVFAAAASLIAVPAFAQVRTQTVGFADLNLASAEGRTALDQRIERAARSVCNVGTTTDLKSFIGSKACYRGSVTAARESAAEVIAQRAARVEVASR